MDQLQIFKNKNKSGVENIYQPVIYNLSIISEKELLNELLYKNDQIKIFDEITGQVEELVKALNPKTVFSKPELLKSAATYINNNSNSPEEFGVWVYYPWSDRLVHILNEKDFIEVRTNRNQYKITKEERDQLAQRKIGVIGLSVGQSVSLTMAMERSFGELRIADFDILELTNLNRIRTGIHNLGVKKVISVAREILEIDPFLKITPFTDGITEENIDHFLTHNGKLDLLIDECDGLHIKILCRQKARELKIPVVMEASDRGMLDIERFDLEPERKILHGLIDHLDISQLKNLKTNEEKMPFLLPMIGIDTISAKLKASMIEIEQTITTWPQLASSVNLGGSICADVTRRILLDQLHVSGRFLIDLEDIVKDENKYEETQILNSSNYELSIEEIYQLIALDTTPNGSETDSSLIRELIHSAIMAPSGGNNQPWKWVYKNNKLYLFNAAVYYPHSLDFQNCATFIALGAATENLYLKAQSLGINVSETRFPLGNNKLVAVFSFSNQLEPPSPLYENLADYISKRVTNRKVTERKIIDKATLEYLKTVAESEQGAKVIFIDSQSTIDELAKIIGRAEKLRILDEQGHKDFINEIRWTSEEVLNSRDGIDIDTIDLSPSEKAGLSILKDKHVIDLLNKWGKGSGLEKLVMKTVKSASVLGILTMPKFNSENYYLGGRAIQRLWLAANEKNISFQPQSPITFLFARLRNGHGQGMSAEMISELTELRKKFELLTGLSNDSTEILLFRLFIGENLNSRSLRKTVDDVAYFL